MPAVAVGAKSVIFGDLTAYVARIVRGIRFERSDDRYFDTDEIAFRAVIRGDGGLLDSSGAVKHYLGAAT
jgi:HK97 family phage major capsid protein